MKFKHVAGASIVPTLARLVLAFIFMTAGYNKLFVDVPYTPEQAESLKTLGVNVVEHDPAATAARAFEVVPASYRRWIIQDEPEKKADDPTKIDEPTKTEEAQKLLEEAKESAREALDAVKEKSKAAGEAAREKVDAAGEAITEKADEAGEAVKEAASEVRLPKVTLGEGETPEGDAATADEPGTGGGIDTPSGGVEYRAKALHRVTLLCDGVGMPSPEIMSMVAAWTELAGGALLLIGVLSRIWGLGLAIAMGTAFYLTSWSPLCELMSNGGPLALAKDLGSNLSLFNMAGAQLSLFVLSFGIFLTGPGPISLDRFLFGRRGKAKESGTIVFDGGEDGG